MGNRATGDPSPGGAVLSLAWLAAASFVVILAMGIRWGLQGIDVW